MSETGLGSFEVDVWRGRALRWHWEVMGTNDNSEPFVMSGTA